MAYYLGVVQDIKRIILETLLRGAGGALVIRARAQITRAQLLISGDVMWRGRTVFSVEQNVDELFLVASNGLLKKLRRLGRRKASLEERKC